MNPAVISSTLALACAGFMATTSFADTRSNELADGSYALFSSLLLPGDDAGHDVAIHGSVAVVGVPYGANSHDEGHRPGNAFICEITTPQPWTNVIDLGTLINLDDSAMFGWSVATDGQRVAVGAPEQSPHGAVFVFQKSALDEWQLEQKVEGPPGSQDFGFSVAVEGDLLFISDPGTAPSGIVFAYSADDNFGAPTEVEPPPSGKFSCQFGYDIEVDGVLVVGAPEHENATSTITGAAYVYSYTDVLDFNQEAILFPPADFQQGGELFGDSVDASSNQETSYETSIVIGAPAQNPLMDQEGSAHVYRYSKAGWVHESTLQDPDGTHVDHFGTSVSIHEDVIAVGAPDSTATGPSSGHAIVFRYSPTAQLWVQEAVIRPVHQTEGSRFGTSVSVQEFAALGETGIHFVVGAPGMNNWIQTESGLGLVYGQLEDGTWQRDLRPIIPIVFEEDSIEAPEVPGGSPFIFGDSISISGNTALVGDSQGTAGTRSGRGSEATGVVHVLTRASEIDPWVAGEEEFVLPDNLQQESLFGIDVAIAGDVAVVGAKGQAATGAAWIYLRSEKDGNWYPQVELAPPGGDVVTGFGHCVSIANGPGVTFIAVGGPGMTYDIDNPGQVYVYEYSEASPDEVSLSEVMSPQSYVPGQSHSSFGTSLDLDVNEVGIVRLAIGDPTWPWDDTNQGSVDMYVNMWGDWEHVQTVTLSNSVQGFGTSLDLAGSKFVSGAPDCPPSGVAGIFRNTMGLTQDHWELEWTLSGHDSYGDRFGTEVAVKSDGSRIIVTAPGIDYLAANSGHAMVFAKENSGMANAWAPVNAFIASDAQPNDEMRSIALEGSTILIGCPTDGYEGAGAPRVLEFELAELSAWNDHSGTGSLSNVGSWMLPPEDGSTALFSLLLADPYTVDFDLPTWSGSMQLALDQVTFLLGAGFGGDHRVIGGNLTIASQPDIKTAVLKLFGGELRVENNLTLGSEEAAGQLVLGSTELSVQGVMSMDSSSSLSMRLSNLGSGRDDDPSEPLSTQIATQTAPEIRGTLEVVLDDGASPEDLEAGDRFVLLVSDSPPAEGEDRFDVVVLPGLTADLGFQLQYGEAAARGDLRGSWEVAIEVVNLSDLLEFGDPATTSVDANAVEVEVVDLNNDNAEEICVIFDDNPGQLVVFENDGAGGIAQQIIVNTGDEPVDITSGDFDGDGNQDLAVANHLSQDISVYLNDDADPSDGFTAADFSPGVIPTCLAGFDYLGADELDDLVIGYENASGPDGGFIIFVALNPLRGFGFGGQQDIATNGAPVGVDPNEDEKKKDVPFGGIKKNGYAVGGRVNSSMAAGPTIVLDDYPAGADLQDIVLGDVNGDTLADLVITSASNNAIPLLLQDTTNPGTFEPALQVPVGTDPGSLATIDFNADGNMDLAAVTTNLAGERVVRILQNDGNLSFTSLDLAEGESPVLVDAGDIDGSGTNDLVTIGDGGSLLRGDGTPLLAMRATYSICDCNGDTDCNGTVDIEDLLAVIANYGCTRDCVADTTGDGIVDIEDLLDVISGWGNCS